MSSKFDSSFLESVPHNKQYKTAQENVYFYTEDNTDGGYCGLTQTSALREPSTTAHRNQKRHSNAQVVRGISTERNKGHKNVPLQDAGMHNPQHFPISSTNRANRVRLASDSEIRKSSVSRCPQELSLTRMSDGHNTRNITLPESSIRVQPSTSTLHGNRRISEGLPSDTVITSQPKPRVMFPREPTCRGLSDTRENPSRNPVPKPRTMLPNDSKSEMGKSHNLIAKRIPSYNEDEKKTIPREGRSQTRETNKVKLDLNMNRTGAQSWHKDDKAELRQDRVGRPMIKKETPTEERSLNHGAPRDQREKRPQFSSDVSSSRFQRQGNMEFDNTRKGQQRPPPLSAVYRNEALEVTSTIPPCSPRIRELRREETAVKYPPLGLAFPRPHSFDVPENKNKILRTLSTPDMRVSSIEELLNIRNDREKREGKEEHQNHHQNYNNNEHFNQVNPQSLSNCSKSVVKIKGKRSKSLPVAANSRRSLSMGRRGPSADSSPLRYFAYLGKRFQFRERLLSAHNVLSARPVILTSTTVISPEVTTNFCHQLEQQDCDPSDDSVKYQGACQDLIDCCTCMCCVKALFYHCTKDDESEGHYAEHPCSCNGPANNCFGRWSALGLLSMVMPCILCYLPIQGCKLGVEYLRRKSDNPDSEQ